MITVYEHNFIMEDEHHNSATTTAATTTTSATLSDIDTPIDASEFEGLEEPEDLTEFTCFPSLPPEMRLKIVSCLLSLTALHFQTSTFHTQASVKAWCLILKITRRSCQKDANYLQWNVATHDVEPRVIEVMWSKSGRQYYTPSVVPGILQASQESRECGLRRYTRLDIATDSIMKIDLPGMRGSFVTYIDYNHDMVYVCNTTFRETRIGGELMSYFLSIFIPSSTGPDSLISTSKSSGIKTSRLQHVALDVMDFKARPFTHGIRKCSQYFLLSFHAC